MNDMANWCACILTPSSLTLTHHTSLPDSLFILIIHTLLLSCSLFQYLIPFSLTQNPLTPLRSTPLNCHRPNQRARPARHFDTKHFKRKEARKLYSTTTPNKAASLTTICNNDEATPENTSRLQIKHRSKRKRGSTRLLKCLPKHNQTDNTSPDNTRHNVGRPNTPTMQCNKHPT